MVNKPLELLIYENETGNEPFVDWLNSLDKTVRAKIFSRLDRLEQGNYGDCKHVGDSVFELRIHSGPGYRIYFGKVKDVVVLLLTAGLKASQKQDLKKAKSYWKEFQKRKTK